MRSLLLLSVQGIISCILAANGASAIRWGRPTAGATQDKIRLRLQSERNGGSNTDWGGHRLDSFSEESSALPFASPENSKDRCIAASRQTEGPSVKLSFAAGGGAEERPSPDQEEGSPRLRNRFIPELRALRDRATAGLQGIFRRIAQSRFWPGRRGLPSFRFEGDAEPGQDVIVDALSLPEKGERGYRPSWTVKAHHFVQHFFLRQGTVLTSLISNRLLTVHLGEFLWEDIDESVFRVTLPKISSRALELHIFHIPNTVAAIPMYTHLVRQLKQAAAVPEEMGFASAEEMYRDMRCLVPADLFTKAGSRDLILSSEPTSHANIFSVQPEVTGHFLGFVKGKWSFPNAQSDDAARFSLTVQLVKLVAAYHSKKLVHGRLSPASFVVTANGTLFLRPRLPLQPETPRILDPSFPFSPPESLLENALVTPAADAWSLGLMIYAVWCHGNLPFGLGYREFDSDQYAATHKPFDIFTVPARPKPWRDPFCNPSSPVGEFIDKLLAFSPSRRLLPRAALSNEHFLGIQQELDRALQQLRTSR